MKRMLVLLVAFAELTFAQQSMRNNFVNNIVNDPTSMNTPSRLVDGVPRYQSRCSIIDASADSVYEVFPLAKGLHYVYEYKYRYEAYDFTIPYNISTDSGVVEYTILDSTVINSDTTVWHVLEKCNLRYEVWVANGIDTTYTKSDSSLLSLIEWSKPFREHELFVSGLVWQFPIQPEYDMRYNQGGEVYRYADTTDIEWHGPILIDTYETGYDTIRFSIGKGFYYRSLMLYSGNSNNGDSSRLIVDFLDPITKVKRAGDQVKTFHLFQNYPNPFNPSTTISYELPGNSLVTLKIYDVLGREVTTLVNESESAGIHKVVWNAYNFPSGMYFCKIQTGKFTETGKILLLK